MQNSPLARKEPYRSGSLFHKCVVRNQLITWDSQYSKTYVEQPLKIDKRKILMANGSLMKVESIAECSPWSSFTQVLL